MKMQKQANPDCPFDVSRVRAIDSPLWQRGKRAAFFNGLFGIERICALHGQFKSAVLSGILCGLLALASAAAEASDNTRLVFLGNKNIAPVVYLDNGTPAGVVVDIVHALAKHMPQPVEIRAMDWAEAQALVARGEADALIQINETDERKKIYDFSDTLLESQFSIFVSADRVGISGVSSLQGLRVGVEAGGLPRKVLEKNPHILLTIIPNFLDGFKLLNAGAIDAVVVDYRVGSYVIAENKLRNIRITGDPIAFSYSAIAVKKGNTKLLAAINQALQTVKSDGTYQKILDKWKPTEVVFQTREQIAQKIYYLTTGILLILFLIAILWTVTLRKELTRRKATEEELRKSNAKYRRIVDTATEGIWELGRDLMTVFVNARMANMLGYSSEEMIGRPFTDFMFEEDEPDHEKKMKGRHQGLSESYERRLRCKDGRTILTLASATPIFDEVRQFIGSFAMFTDITERKQAETARLINLHYFESMDRVNRAIQGASDLEQMMSDVLDVVLATFDCDRAFLLYPCDPEAASWSIPVESCKPEYPGVLKLGFDVPTSNDVAQTFKTLLETEGPLKFGPGTEHPLPADTSERFGFKCFMSMAIRPRIGRPWEFGLHQCSHVRNWTAEEERLFQEIGRRLADGLSTMLVYRDLRESEAKYRRIVDTATEGIWGFGPDTTTTFVNTRMANMLGYSSGEMTGRLMTDFMFDEDVPDYRQRLEGRRRGVQESYERRFRRKDGQTLWTLVSATPVLDDQHRFQGAFGMFTDITERKRAEEALQKSEALLNTTQRLTKVGGWEFDIKTGKSFWTEELYRIHEMPNDAGIDLVKESLVHYAPEDRQIINDAFQRACERGEPYDLEFPFTTGSGKPLWVRTTAQPIYEEGKVVRLVGNFIDITERKRAEEEIRKLNQELELRVKERTAQLETANKELEAFSYSVSHDLRTPLRAIDGFSHILLDSYAAKLDDEGRRLLRVVRENTSRMAQLIDDMLKFSRTGRVEISFSKIDMEKLARDVFEELRPSVANNKLQVEIEHLPSVRGDSAMMRQVFVNLLANAIKFSRNSEAPRIKVGGIVEGDDAIYYVKDNGVGFNMQYSDKLFGVFQRLHSVNEFEGTGIGLAIVKRIITRHGGRVWAEGKVNEGATVYFSIPAGVPFNGIP